jgi:hypothetical protein
MTEERKNLEENLKRKVLNKEISVKGYFYILYLLNKK